MKNSKVKSKLKLNENQDRFLPHEKKINLKMGKRFKLLYFSDIEL